MNLDIGLPLDQLRQPVRVHLSDPERDPEVIVVDAVNRRGRAVEVKVTLTHIVEHGDLAPAAMLVMDVVGTSN